MKTNIITRLAETVSLARPSIPEFCHRALGSLALAVALGLGSPATGFGQAADPPVAEPAQEPPAHEPEKHADQKVPRERAVPAKPKTSKFDAQLHEPTIVVKFHEGTHVRHRAGKLTAEPQKRTQAEAKKLTKLKLADATLNTDLDELNKHLAKDARRLARLFTRDEADLDKDKAEADRDAEEEGADLNLYFRIHVDTAQPAEIEELLNKLNAMDSVEIAYPEPKSEPAAVDFYPATPSLTASQGYLSAAPTGIDVNWVRSYAGSRGDGVRIVDIENAWNLYHEDLNWPFFISGVMSTDPRSINHGTAVLGEIAAAENAYGMSGIVPRAAIGVSAVSAGFANALNSAAAQLGYGDIILIEQHAPGPPSGLICYCNCSQFGYIPMEYWQANYDAIRNATARGIIVVEAAGNGSMNLDSPIYGGRFNRNVRDSGAILVGAGTPMGRVPECWSNFGSRVDAEGWGDSVATLGYGDLRMVNGADSRQWYTGSFSGTSSASPIVTGAAAAIQGMRKARGLPVLNSYQMRRLLWQTGTPQASDSRNIGPLPNLRTAFESHGTYAYLYPSTSYGWASGVVAPQGYRDYYFYSYGGRYYEFSTCYYADFDTVIEVYNPYGTLIAYNDDYCGLKSYLTPWASVPGWYRVRVRGYASDSGFFWMYHRVF